MVPGDFVKDFGGGFWWGFIPRRKPKKAEWQTKYWGVFSVSKFVGWSELLFRQNRRRKHNGNRFCSRLSSFNLVQTWASNLVKWTPQTVLPTGNTRVTRPCNNVNVRDTLPRCQSPGWSQFSVRYPGLNLHLPLFLGRGFAPEYTQTIGDQPRMSYHGRTSVHLSQ